MNHKKLALAAALSGLFSASHLLAADPTPTPDGKPPAGKHGCNAKEKNSCSGKSGCGAKEKEKSSCSAKAGCDGKDKKAEGEKASCSGKAGCSAKEKPKT